MSLHGGLQTRRHFLKSGVGIAAAALFSGCASFPGLVRGARQSRILIPSDEPGADSRGSKLTIYSPASRTTEVVPLPVDLVHAAFVHPSRPDRVIVTGQFHTLCVVNISDLRVEREVSAGDDGSAQFYGHGAFSPDGSHFYTSENLVEKGMGRISVRRSSDLAVVDEIPSFGRFPHDFAFLEDGRTLAIANHGYSTLSDSPGKDSNLTYVDVNSKKLLGKVEIPDEGCFASHLIRLKGDQILLGARRSHFPSLSDFERERAWIKNPATRLMGNKRFFEFVRYLPAPLYWIQGEKIVQRETLDYGRRLNCLSLVHAPKLNLIGATHAAGNLISFWDPAARKQVKSLISESAPMGLCISEDGAGFYVTLGSGKMSYIDGKRLELDKVHPVDIRAGVHISHTFC